MAEQSALEMAPKPRVINGNYSEYLLNSVSPALC